MSSWKNNRIFLILAGGIFLGLSSLAQTLQPAAQIGPGTTGSISPAQGVNSPAGGAPNQTLDGALSSKTRQTLQDAMNSIDVSTVPTDHPLVDLSPGEGAELDGSTANRVALSELPASLQRALRTGVEKTLGQGAAR